MKIIMLSPLAVLLLLVWLLVWFHYWSVRKAKRDHIAYLKDREKRRGDHMFHPDVERAAIKQRIRRNKRRFWWR